ncbi:MAG: putative response regulator, CheY [Verrucomicrobia bacterium]|jgi:DNA-binding response OmpR family regulator|nr:putative response regulator, CheY [Verrucomicrobiota bacterium]
MSGINILHVEDREEDVFLLKYAFKRAQINNPVNVASDGQMAIDYLAGNGQFSDRRQFPLPCLVLLDLQLPHVIGLDVLAWIRKQPEWKRLVVIVLSSSIHDNDIIRAYELGVNGFLVKPSDANNLADMCTALKQYWLTHNRFAPDCTPGLKAV